MNTQQQTSSEPTDAEAGEILEQLQAEEQPQEAPEDTQDAPEDDGPSKASREAAKYRKRAQDAEGKAEQLTQQLDALQRQLIDSVIEREGMSPALLWRTGLETQEVLDKDGAIDPGLIRQACDTVRTEFGLDRNRIDPAQQATAVGLEDKAEQLFRGTA